MDLVSINVLTNAWVVWSDSGVTGGRFLYMTKCHCSSNMAAMAAILDLFSVDYLTNACVD
jgi:hypothetical protein